MNKKWIIAAMSALIVSFSSCKDDDMSQEEMYSELVQNGTDWVALGLKGKVETMTQSGYSSIEWNNNTVKKGKESYRYNTHFGSDGFITGYSQQSLVPVSIKWTTDKSGNDVIVVTSEFKTTYETTKTLDQRHREIESNTDYTNYSTKIGDYAFNGYNDTITYSQVKGFGVKVGDQMKTEKTTTPSGKTTYTYDDANGTAQGTEYYYDSTSKSFEVSRKTDYPLDENNRIIPGYENENGKNRAAENYTTEKVIVNRDNTGNIAEKYILSTYSATTSIYNYSTWSYTYY